MADTMMTLGSFQFSIDTAAFDDLKRVTTYRWKQQERLGREPANQFIGIGNDKFTINGTIYPAYRGGLGQINQMREAAALGEEQQLIDGTGNVIGPFVITSITEVQTVFASEGVPLKQEFTMELAQYGEDQTTGGGDREGGGDGDSGGGFNLFGGNGWVTVANTVSDLIDDFNLFS